MGPALVAPSTVTSQSSSSAATTGAAPASAARAGRRELRTTKLPVIVADVTTGVGAPRSTQPPAPLAGQLWPGVPPAGTVTTAPLGVSMVRPSVTGSATQVPSQ